MVKNLGHILQQQLFLIVRIVFILLILLNILYFSEGAVAAQGVPPGMISYWKLDDIAGPPFLDALGLNDATCINCPIPVPGKINGAAVFNGNDTGLDVPVDPAFDWGQFASFAIGFWFKAPATGSASGNQVIVGRNDNMSGLHWWVGLNTSGQAAFQLRDRLNQGLFLEGNIDLSDDSWHYLVAVRDAAVDENRLYVDGRLERSGVFVYTAGFDAVSADLNIGWLNLSDGFHYEGALDEVALYNRALSETEIRSHYYLSRGYSEMCIDPVRIMPLGDSITYDSHSGDIRPSSLRTSYRQPLWLSLTGTGYNVDFVHLKFSLWYFLEPCLCNVTAWKNYYPSGSQNNF